MVPAQAHEAGFEQLRSIHVGSVSFQYAAGDVDPLSKLLSAEAPNGHPHVSFYVEPPS